jgi:hypothetical protein
VSPDEILREPVVLMVRVEVPEALATEVRLKAQVGPGVPPVMLVQASETAPVNPPTGAIVITAEADPPGAIAAGVNGAAAAVKSGAATLKLMVVLCVVAPEVPTTVTVEFVGVEELVLKVRVDVPDAVREFGENEQLTPAGSDPFAQVRLTVPLNPLLMVTVTVDVPSWPREETVTGVPPIEKSGVLTKPGHDVTSTLASTDPRPVTLSYPVTALKPI